MAYDSAATKERILAAATTEFADHGIAGARVDRIAAAAPANKRAIYDYFGDKDALFRAVLDRAMDRLTEAVPPSADLREYAGALFDYHRENPQTLRLVMWETLELRGAPMHDEQERTEHYLDKVRAAETATAPGGDPRALVFFTLSLVDWALAMPQLRHMIFGPDHALDDLRPALQDAVQALVDRFSGKAD